MNKEEKTIKNSADIIYKITSKHKLRKIQKMKKNSKKKSKLKGDYNKLSIQCI